MVLSRRSKLALISARFQEKRIKNVRIHRIVLNSLKIRTSLHDPAV